MIKWHDLKKNPMDLPKDGDGHLLRSADVVVYLEHGEGNEYWYTLGYYSYEHKKWRYSMGKERFAEPITVAKWAYVEHTEDAEPSPKADLTKLRDDLIKGTKSVNAGLQEFVTATRDDDKSVFCEALTRSIISSMASEICYGIMKEFDAYGKID